MSNRRVLSELMQLLREEKKYWLLPVVIVFLLLGTLMVFSQSSCRRAVHLHAVLRVA